MALLRVLQVVLQVINFLQMSAFVLGALLRPELGGAETHTGIRSVFTLVAVLNAGSMDQYVGPTWYMVFFAAALGWVASYVYLILATATRFIAEKPHSVPQLRALRAVALLSSTILFVPLQGLMLRWLSCTGISETLFDGSCWTGLHLVLSLVVLAVSPFFLSWSLLISLVLLVRNPLSDSLGARTSGRTEVIMLVEKVALVALLSVAGAALAPVVTAVCLTITAISWLWLFIRGQPNLSPFMNDLRAGFGGAFAFATMCVWLALFSSGELNVGPLALSGMVVAAGAAFAASQARRAYVASAPLQSLSTASDAELWARRRIQMRLVIEQHAVWGPVLRREQAAAKALRELRARRNHARIANGPHHHGHNGDAAERGAGASAAKLPSASRKLHLPFNKTKASLASHDDGRHGRSGQFGMIVGNSQGSGDSKASVVSYSRRRGRAGSVGDRASVASGMSDASRESRAMVKALRAAGLGDHHTVGGHSHAMTATSSMRKRARGFRGSFLEAVRAGLQPGRADSVSLVVLTQTLDGAAESALKYGAARWSSSSQARIALATFYQYVRQSTVLELLALSGARDTASALEFDVLFLVFMRTRQLRERNEDVQGSSASGGVLSAIERIAYEQLWSEALYAQMLCYKANLRMWGALSNRQPDLALLQSTGQQLRKNIEAAERAYERMLRMNEGSVKVLRSYADFMERVLQDKARAEQLRTRASKQIAAASSSAARGAIEHVHFFSRVHEDISSSSEGLGVVTVSLAPNKVGQIVDINAVASRLLFRPRSTLVGRSMSVLVPQPITPHHDQWLRGYAMSGVGEAMGATRITPMIRSDGAMIPVRMQYAEAAPVMDSPEPRVNCFMMSVDTKENWVFFAGQESEYRIYCASPGSHSLMGTSADDFDDDISVLRWFPEVDSRRAPPHVTGEAYEATDTDLRDGAPGGGLDRPAAQLPPGLLSSTSLLRQAVGVQDPVHTVVVNTADDSSVVAAKIQRVAIPGTPTFYVLAWRRADAAILSMAAELDAGASMRARPAKPHSRAARHSIVPQAMPAAAATANRMAAQAVAVRRTSVAALQWSSFMKQSIEERRASKAKRGSMSVGGRAGKLSSIALQARRGSMMVGKPQAASPFASLAASMAREGTLAPGVAAHSPGAPAPPPGHTPTAPPSSSSGSTVLKTPPGAPPRSRGGTATHDPPASTGGDLRGRRPPTISRLLSRHSSDTASAGQNSVETDLFGSGALALNELPPGAMILSDMEPVSARSGASLCELPPGAMLLDELPPDAQIMGSSMPGVAVDLSSVQPSSDGTESSTAMQALSPGSSLSSAAPVGSEYNASPHSGYRMAPVGAEQSLLRQGSLEGLGSGEGRSHSGPSAYRSSSRGRLTGGVWGDDRYSILPAIAEHASLASRPDWSPKHAMSRRASSAGSADLLLARGSSGDVTRKPGALKHSGSAGDLLAGMHWDRPTGALAQPPITVDVLGPGSTERRPSVMFYEEPLTLSPGERTWQHAADVVKGEAQPLNSAAMSQAVQTVALVRRAVQSQDPTMMAAVKRMRLCVFLLVLTLILTAAGISFIMPRAELALHRRVNSLYDAGERVRLTQSSVLACMTVLVNQLLLSNSTAYQGDAAQAQLALISDEFRSATTRLIETGQQIDGVHLEADTRPSISLTLVDSSAIEVSPTYAGLWLSAKLLELSSLPLVQWQVTDPDLLAVMINAPEVLFQGWNSTTANVKATDVVTFLDFMSTVTLWSFVGLFVFVCVATAVVLAISAHSLHSDRKQVLVRFVEVPLGAVRALRKLARAQLLDFVRETRKARTNEAQNGENEEDVVWAAGGGALEDMLGEVDGSDARSLMSAASSVIRSGPSGADVARPNPARSASSRRVRRRKHTDTGRFVVRTTFSLLSPLLLVFLWLVSLAADQSIMVGEVRKAALRTYLTQQLGAWASELVTRTTFLVLDPLSLPPAIRDATYRPAVLRSALELEQRIDTLLNGGELFGVDVPEMAQDSSAYQYFVQDACELQDTVFVPVNCEAVFSGVMKNGGMRGLLLALLTAQQRLLNAFPSGSEITVMEILTNRVDIFELWLDFSVHEQPYVRGATRVLSKLFMAEAFATISSTRSRQTAVTGAFVAAMLLVLVLRYAPKVRSMGETVLAARTLLLTFPAPFLVILPHVEATMRSVALGTKIRAEDDDQITSPVAGSRGTRASQDSITSAA